MKRRLIASLLGVSFGIAAGTAVAGDLLQAYRDALAADSQFAAARATAEAGRERVVQGRAGLLPTVGASASVFNNHSDTNLSSSKSFLTADLGLSLSQPLYRWQNWIAAEQGELSTAQAEAALAQAQQDLTLRVVEAYFAVLNAAENQRAIRAQKAAFAQQLELAKKSFEVGTVTITDTHEAQFRYDQAIAQEVGADNALEVARQLLNSLLGKDAGALAALKAGATLSTPQPADLKAWVGQAEKFNIAVKVQEFTAQLAQKTAEAARAGHRPTVDLVATYGLNRNELYKDSPAQPSQTNTLRYGVQLNVPLYTGGATESRIRETGAQRDAAQAALAGARTQAGLAARQAYLGVVSGLAQVKALEAAEVSSQSKLESTKVGYEVGVRINNDVLTAEQELQATRRDLYKARLDTLQAQLKLKAAVGALSEDDLRLVNAQLAM